MSSGLQVGLLRDPVRIERKTVTRDAAGSELYAWGATAQRMAQISYITGREYVAAGDIRAEVTVKITMRLPLDIGAEDRIVKISDGTIFGVAAVLPIGNAKQGVEVMCRVGVEDGR